VVGGSGGNNLQDNDISGNTGDGVFITSSKNTVQLGHIGTTSDGTVALANGGNGVHVAGGSGNVIGKRTTISGNTGAGVFVEKATGTLITGDFIGTNGDGTAAIENGAGGIIVGTGAVNTTIGGTASGAGNLISGNDPGNGVLVEGNAGGTLIQGNSIGIDAAGTHPQANLHGLVIQDTAADTTVGGTTAGAGNLISFNTLSGINLTGAATGILIQGNTIGLDKNGATAPNLKDGINVQGGSGTTIGGTAAGADNVISGNNGKGVEFSGPDVTLTNDVIGNLIGTAARGNGMAGVLVDDLTAQVHSLSILSNTISGNAHEGVLITDSDQVSVGSNKIG
jgi:parallel beta-helix repeat protein